MSNYFFKIIILKDNDKKKIKSNLKLKDFSSCYECYYSNQAITILKKYDLPYTIIKIDYKNKDNSSLTYPIVYLNKKNSLGNLLLGSYNDLLFVLKKFTNKYSEKDVNEFMNKYKWSKKITLRLIELINHL